MCSSADPVPAAEPDLYTCLWDRESSRKAVRQKSKVLAFYVTTQTILSIILLELSNKVRLLAIRRYGD